MQTGDPADWLQFGGRFGLPRNDATVDFDNGFIRSIAMRAAQGQFAELRHGDRQHH